MVEGEFREVPAQQSAQLNLSANDSLPWLESDDEAQTTGGVSTAQVAGLVTALLAVLALVVGAVWYLSNGTGQGTIEPDGSIIAAPEGPIRERPEDPGGRQFAGTGSVAPVVGEGGTREGVMAVTDDSAPGAGASTVAPSIDVLKPDDSETMVEAPTPDSAQSAQTSTGGVAVQLAAYRSRQRAERGWRELRSRTDVLDGIDYRIVRGTVDIGTVYRLQAVRGTRAAGEALCDALKADGLDCQVKP